MIVLEDVSEQFVIKVQSDLIVLEDTRVCNVYSIVKRISLFHITLIVVSN